MIVVRIITIIIKLIAILAIIIEHIPITSIQITLPHKCCQQFQPVVPKNELGEGNDI